MDLLIGLDIGTSSIKGILISTCGKQIAAARRINRFIYPEPDLIELEPELHYRSVCDLIVEAFSAMGGAGRIITPDESAVKEYTFLYSGYLEERSHCQPPGNK